MHICGPLATAAFWVVWLVCCSPVPLQAQEVDTLMEQQEQPEEDTRQTVLDIMSHAGGFQWPILGVFVLGLAALMRALVRVYLDGREARHVRSLDIPNAVLEELRQATALPGDSLYHMLLSGLMRRYALDTAAGALQTAVRRLVEQSAETYQLTRRLVAYCSAAAGGLGLTGTLVGIYTTFSAAGTDPQTVLAGISLAVVSTLLGVVASLLLEAADTYVDRVTTRYLSRAEDWGEEACLRLAYLARYSAMARRRHESKNKA